MRFTFMFLAGLLIGCVGEAPPANFSADASVNTTADANVVSPIDGGTATDAATVETCYSEPVFPQADIADVIAAYGGANFKDELIEAMGRRHPASGYLLNAQRNDSYFNQFSDSSSWTGMVGWLDTLSHEETHLFNAYHAQAQGQVHSLFHREDLIIYLPTDTSFGRGEIYDDISQSARDGIYAPTYLTGSQGERGFQALLDEHNCYLNEVAAVGSVGEYFNGGVSLRDGSAAFLYFIAVYLRVARTEQPTIYNQLKSSEPYRRAVETAWLRTHFFLDIANAFPNLGINDDMYLALAHEQANMDEIGMFIGKTVQASACLQ